MRSGVKIGGSVKLQAVKAPESPYWIALKEQYPAKAFCFTGIHIESVSTLAPKIIEAQGN